MIAEEIRTGLPEVLGRWREMRGSVAGEEPSSEMVDGIGRLLEAFTDFLQSPLPIEEFGREGKPRALVQEISGRQREAGRYAVGVIEDYAALRRSVWRHVEERVNLSEFDGGEVSRFFVKLMQASDWVTKAGLQAFDDIVHEDMESALGEAVATDLLTGLPDRELFNRRLLPQVIADHDRVAVVIFDLVGFTDTVAAEGPPGGAKTSYGSPTPWQRLRPRKPPARDSGTPRSAPYFPGWARRAPTRWPRRCCGGWRRARKTCGSTPGSPDTRSTGRTPASFWARRPEH